MKQDIFASLNGAAQLEQAIEAWRVDERYGEEYVVDRVAHAARMDAEVIVSIQVPDDFLTEVATESMNGEKTFTNKESVSIKVPTLMNEEGEAWLAVFTSEEQFHKGEGGSSMNMPLKDMIECAFEGEGCSGLVINPWDKQLSITKPVLGVILDCIAEPTTDEYELQKGSDAYQNGDYEQALVHYRYAAEMGNVTAMSNLGYCYYYGRSVPVDKAKARECWEKAAVFDDICAIYKLGDMYRNGDLPEDPVFSRAMYMRALYLASREKNIWCYPDACLRVMKYCRDEIPDEILRTLAYEAVEGIELRIEEGDTLSDKLYQEALALKKSICDEADAGLGAETET